MNVKLLPAVLLICKQLKFCAPPQKLFTVYLGINPLLLSRVGSYGRIRRSEEYASPFCLIMFSLFGIRYHYYTLGVVVNTVIKIIKAARDFFVMCS